MNATLNAASTHMDVQQEIESHEQELRALLTRVLPMGQVLSQIDAQRAHVTGLAEAVDFLRTREVPLVLDRTSQIDAAIKKVNRALDSLSEVVDEHHLAISTSLREHAHSVEFQGSQMSGMLAVQSAELLESQAAISVALGRLGNKLTDQQRELCSLVQPLVGDVAAVRTDIVGRIVTLADQVQAMTDGQKSAADRALAGSNSLRRLIITSAVMSTVTLAGVLGLLVGILL